MSLLLALMLALLVVLVVIIVGGHVWIWWRDGVTPWEIWTEDPDELARRVHAQRGDR